MSDYITIEDRGVVRWLRLDAPDRKNAIPEDGWEPLAQAFYDFGASDQRVLVVAGEGEDFCAGADLSDVAAEDSAWANARRMAGPNEAAMALHRLAKPTIAAVDGVAVGAGMNLALGCDLIVATDRARFSQIFVRRGLTLDFGGSWLLPRVVGLAKARELAMTGRFVDAAEAAALGIVARVVAPEDLVGAATDLADELAAGAPLAQLFIKRALDRSATMTFEQALAFEEQSQAILLGSRDVREAAAAFGDKRDPRFDGT